MIQMTLSVKQKYSHRQRKQTYGYQRGQGGIREENEIPGMEQERAMGRGPEKGGGLCREAGLGGM